MKHSFPVFSFMREVHPFLSILSLTLTLSHLTIWCFGQTALFLLAKVALAYLPTAFFLALRPLFPFQHAQYTQVFPLKPAPLCKLFAGLGSTNNLPLLLLSDSRSVLSSVFPFTSISLAGTDFSVLLFYQTTMGRRNLFLPGSDAADELVRRGALLVPSVIPYSLSPLFSDWRRTVSSKFFDTQISSIFTEEIVLPVFSLVYAATNTAFF